MNIHEVRVSTLVHIYIGIHTETFDGQVHHKHINWHAYFRKLLDIFCIAFLLLFRLSLLTASSLLNNSNVEPFYS